MKLLTKEGISNHWRHTWLPDPSGVANACPQTYLKDDSAGSFFMTCSRRVNKPLFPSHTKLLKKIDRDTGFQSRWQHRYAWYSPTTSELQSTEQQSFRSARNLAEKSYNKGCKKEDTLGLVGGSETWDELVLHSGVADKNSE